MPEEIFEVKNAIIKKAAITIDDGWLDCWLELEYTMMNQRFGGYALYLPKSFTHHKLESVAGHHIFRIMEVAGVTRWDQLVGKSIRVNTTNDRIKGIGHIIKEDWFSPEQDYKLLKTKPEEVKA